MKDFILNAIDTIKDDRWSFGFKVLNIISNDTLRQSLAFANIHVMEAMECCDRFMEERPTKKHVMRHLKRARENIEDIWGWHCEG